MYSGTSTKFSMTFRALRALLRCLVLLLIAVYFLLAGVLLVGKYWLVPRIDQWRPDIEAVLSNALGLPVTIDKIQAEWGGMMPAFEISGVTVKDGKGHDTLTIPSVQARLSWRSLTAIEPIFSYIVIDDIGLSVIRNREGKLQVAGLDLDTSPKTEQARDEGKWFEREPFRWLLNQGMVSISNATVVWVDEQRDAPALQLEKFSVSLQNRLLSHRLVGRFDLASSPGQQVEFVLRSDRLKTGLGNLIGQVSDGELYVSVSNFDPQSLRQWVDMPPIYGRYAARAWLELSQGRLGDLTLDLAGLASGMHRDSAEESSWRADHLKVRLNGPVAMVFDDAQISKFVMPVEGTKVVSMRFQGENLTIDPPQDVMSELNLLSVGLQASMSRSMVGDWQLNIQNLSAATPDVDLKLRGNWKRVKGDALGQLDITGTLSDVNLPRLYSYLPKAVGEDVLEWMEHAFTAGEVPQAGFVVKGPVEKFPFEKPSDGEFTIDGTIKGWTIDYAPSEQPGTPGWAPVTDINGRLSMNRDVISVVAPGANLRVGEQGSIAVSRLQADLSDLYSKPLLRVKAQTRADAQLYQEALTKTALADVVPPFVQDLSGQGDWLLGLDLQIPLDDVEQTIFKAGLDFNGGSLRYATLPPLEGVTGTALVSNEGFHTGSLVARLLDGQVEASGNVGSEDANLKIQGSVGAKAVNEFFKTPSLNRWVKGNLPFNVELTRDKADGPYRLQVTSDMKGLQLAFPPPFASSTNAALNTQLQWEIRPDSKSPGQGSLKIGNLLLMQAVGRDSGQGSVLSSVTIGIGAEPLPVREGLTLNVQSQQINASAWMDVFDGIARDLDATPSSERTLFPTLHTARLNSAEVLWDDTPFHDVKANLTAQQNEYKAHFEARQANGEVSWKTHNGQRSGAIHVQLARLDLAEFVRGEKGNQDVAASKLPDPKAISNIPPLVLTIGDLRVGEDMQIGRLEVVGENANGNRRWNIQKLLLSSPAMQLNATGQWRFDDPGIDLDFKMDLKDFGKALASVGVKDRILGGHGTINGKLTWKDFPWQSEFSKLSGNVQIDLADGVFANVESGSARVLRLLSLQSFSRLLNASLGNSDVMGSGFPWNTIAGKFEITHGLVNTESLRVISPVARIRFRGSVNLVEESLNLRAVIRPNLDLSGTAVATGFLLNPIVGLSALVGNYLLKRPIERALTLRYDVTGSWSDPKLNELGVVDDSLLDDNDAESAPRPLNGAVPSTGNDASTAERESGAGVTGSNAQPEGQPQEKREVYRIELGKDSGFDPGNKPTQ